MRHLVYLLIILKILLTINIVDCKNRVTYYVSIGDRARLQCLSGGGQYFCFSTYTFQNASHPMVMLNNSLKYQIEINALTINNIEATDAGFYACSSNCNQMKSDLIDYYLVPMSGQQPIDVSQNFLAIPPFAGAGSSYAIDNYFVPVRPDTVQTQNRGKVLNDGEIAGIVIGCVAFVVIVAALITVLFVCGRRRASGGDEKKVKGRRNVTAEESADSRNDTLKSDKTLIHAGGGGIHGEIANDDDDKGGRGGRSPRNFRNKTQMNDDESLPNIDILPHSQRSNRGHEIDNQTRKNYELADRIANQFAYEEEQRQQQQQQPQHQQQQQPKQLTARYDSYNNSFSAGLDAAPPQQNNKPPAKYQPQFSNELTTEPPKKLPQNRARIEFPKSQQQQQVEQQLQQQDYQAQVTNRKFSNRSQEMSDQNVNSDSRNESDEDFARRGKRGGAYGYKTNNNNINKLYDLSDEDKAKLSRQTSDDAQQQSLSQSSQQNVPFKSLLKSQKQSKGITDLMNQPTIQQQQPIPTSRSYQGTSVYQQQMQLPPQYLPKQQSQVVYDKRSESTHVERNVKDNTTDV